MNLYSDGKKQMTDFLGKHIGHYRLERVLGTGGFAEVYLATHMHLNTQVAIKILHTRLREEHWQLFHNEALAIANLKHPHIVRMLDFGIEDGQVPYLVMDYLSGGTLRQSYTREAPQPLPPVALSIRQIAEALQYAHDARYIHRDVKPDNMLLSADAHLLLSDFSLAIVAHNTTSQSTQQIMGTILYMAPEQIEHYPRPASDQYALGTVAYEWLCGRPPFSGTMLEIATKHCLVAPPPLRKHNPAIPPVVEDVVLRALEKDWQSRFPDVRAFAQALQEAAHTSAARAIPPAEAAQLPPLVDRLSVAVRPSYRQRSRLPFFKQKTSVRTRAWWMLAYVVLMLVWWLPYVVELLSHLGPALTSVTYLPLYIFVLVGIFNSTEALLAGALFGAQRAAIVTTVATLIIMILLWPGFVWGGGVTVITVSTYLFSFAFCILAALFVGWVQQRRNRRSVVRSYLMMLAGATIVVLGWTPGLVSALAVGGESTSSKVAYSILFVCLIPFASCLLALPVTLIEAFLQHVLGQEGRPDSQR
jgi:hypothetical protein